MELPVCKKPRVVGLRLDLLEIIEELKLAWKSKEEFHKNGVEIILHPYPIMLVKNFVNDGELLKQSCEELKKVHFHVKSNDLYEFKQSDDVRNLTDKIYIKKLYELIKVEAKEWIGNILDENRLKDDISATISVYEYQDRLLCHDDKCEDRHIAFILYLVEDWDESDGGLLEFFNTDLNGYPLEIVKSITPEFNALVFFEVTKNSFHQVSEVKSKTKKRLSINGWFHSSGKSIEKSEIQILKKEEKLANDIVYNLQNYFSSSYFDYHNKTSIKDIFVSESEIQLDNFITPEFFEKIKTELRSEITKWTIKGPANIRKYEIADELDLPKAVRTLKEIFESKCWLKYLKEITGLDLAPSAGSDLNIWQKGVLPVCSVEIQKWTKSCYTLLHDADPEFHFNCLDVILRIPFEEKGEEEEEEEDNDDELNDSETPECGHILYIDSSSADKECLLHIGYKTNSLGLVYRDKKTLRFTKYLNLSAKPFYQILCTYKQWSSPDNQPVLKHCAEDESESEEESVSS